MPLENSLLFMLANFGFPVVVVLWFMYRLETKLDEVKREFRNMRDDIRDYYRNNGG